MYDVVIQRFDSADCAFFRSPQTITVPVCIFQLTTLNFQRAVLLVQRVPPQVHHAGGRRGDPEPEQESGLHEPKIP